jgi:hypothetical protein
MAVLRQACTEESEDHQERNLSHVRHAPERQWENPKVVQELLRHAA